jgi:hypothetical protein
MELDLSLPSVGAAYANKMLAQPGVFDDRARFRRIVQGIATTKKRNKNGGIFAPEGAQWEIPTPLIWRHDWAIPLGRVTAIKATPAGLWFEARLIDGRLEWADRSWGYLKDGRVPAVSVHGWGIPPYDEGRWNLFEISLCEEGACGGALIHVVKSGLTPAVVYLDGRPRETIHRDIRKNVAPSDLGRRFVPGVPFSTQITRESMWT